MMHTSCPSFKIKYMMLHDSCGVTWHGSGHTTHVCVLTKETAGVDRVDDGMAHTSLTNADTHTCSFDGSSGYNWSLTSQ